MKSEKLTFNGVAISLGQQKDLRIRYPHGLDLVRDARVSGNLKSLPRILSRQLALHTRPNERTFDNPPRITAHDILASVRILFGINKDLPLEVAQTVTARFRYGANETLLDPNVFTDNRVSHTPTDRQLASWGLISEDVQKALRQPATLAGSLLFVYYDGIDDNLTWMRKKTSGPYTNSWTIRGGHYDSLSEVAAFEEAKEEAGIDQFYYAQPLGSADQVVAIDNHTGKIALKRYLNLMWEMPLVYNQRPSSIKDGMPWQDFADWEVDGLRKNNLLTPIAECAFNLNPVFK